MEKVDLISSKVIQDATGIESDVSDIGGIGDLYANHAPSILSYISKVELIPALADNKKISHVFCTDTIRKALPDGVTPIVCLDPVWAFFSVVDFLACSQNFGDSRLDLNISSEGSYIAPKGVFIRSGVKLEPFSSVRESTSIGENTVIRSGAAIGLDTFQHQRTKYGIISPRHDGSLRIGKNVEIGANTSISRGFSYRDTIIEDDVKIDCNVSISHGVTIGRGTIICAGVLILGHSIIGDNVFVGPGAVLRNRIIIGDGARVSIGSIVTKNVSAGETVTGNFAVPHESWMSFMKTIK